MLNRRLGILAVGLALVVTVSYAQRKPAGKTAAKPARPAKIVVPQELVTVGSGNPGGRIQKDLFLKEMSKPLSANGQIEGFSFMYGERNVYEDSAGNPLPVTEYLTQYCMGDTLPAVIRNTLLERAKPGDTAYYESIRIRKADGTEAIGKPLKFTLTP